MGPNAIETLRRLVNDHTASVRARRRIAVLSAVLAVALGALAVRGPLADGGSILTRWIWSRPMPEVERQYLRQLMMVLEDGAANRMNIEGVLTTGDSEPDIAPRVPWPEANSTQ